MGEVEISRLKIRQPITCKCGRALTDNDGACTLEGIEIVCSGCHETVLEFHLEVYGEMESW